MPDRIHLDREHGHTLVVAPNLKNNHPLFKDGPRAILGEHEVCGGNLCALRLPTGWVAVSCNSNACNFYTHVRGDTITEIKAHVFVIIPD